MTADPTTWPEQYRAGTSLLRIATEAGVDTKVVRAELLRCGVVIRPSGHRPPGEWRPYIPHDPPRYPKPAADAVQPDAPGYDVKRMDEYEP